MDFLFDGIASALSFLYDLTGSHGGAIMLLTLGVMIVVTPLTLKSTRSMLAMQQLQPELKKLQNKYKDDRQKLNEEMMAFYKEHDINPMGGCLPLLVQMPVFIVLYQVLIGLTRRHSWGSDMGQSVGLFLRDPGSDGTFANFGTFDPKYLDQSSNLYQDLASSREVRSFGLDLADTFMNRFQEGLASGLPYLVLVLIVGVSAWYQQRQIQARNAGNQSQINPQQQALMKIMPFFLPVISLTLPAGIVLYFVVSNLYRIGQQAFITRTMYGDKAKESGSKGGGGARSGGMLASLLGGGAAGGGVSTAKGDETSSETSTSKGGSSKGGSSKGKGSSGKGGGSSKGKGGSGKGGGSAGTASKGSRGTGTRVQEGRGAAPRRQAPSRTAPPSAKNRSKSKKKRK